MGRVGYKFEGDGLRVRVNVRDMQGDTDVGPLDLTGATFAASLGVPGKEGVPGVVEVEGVGVVLVTFPSGMTHPQSTATLQVTKAGLPLTVWSRDYQVKRRVVTA